MSELKELRMAYAECARQRNDLLIHRKNDAERIRVLREALEVTTNWLSEDRCPLGWTVSRLHDTIEAVR